MSKKHTPEPWDWNEKHTNQITIHGETFVACIPWIVPNSLNNHKANAQRIVECVNACAGLSDPIKDIESYHSNVKEVSQDITVLSSAASEFGKMLNLIKEECERTGGLGYNMLAKQIDELMFKHIWVNDVIEKYSNQ